MTVTKINSHILVFYVKLNVNIIFIAGYLSKTGLKNSSCHAVAFRSDRREV